MSITNPTITAEGSAYRIACDSSAMTWYVSVLRSSAKIGELRKNAAGRFTGTVKAFPGESLTLRAVGFAWVPLGDVTVRIPLAQIPLERLLYWHAIGNSSTLNEDRKIARDLLVNGWQWYVDTWMRPCEDLGCKRFILHLPFGANTGETQMDFDGGPESRTSTNQLLKDWEAKFVAAIKPLTARGLEVIGYLGHLGKDPDMLALWDYHSGWLNRAVESVRALLDAGCSIAFDVAHGFPDDSRMAKFVELIESLGHKVYIEPWPMKDKKWTIGRASMTTDYTYYTSGMYNDTATWALPRSQCGEIIRLVDAVAKRNETWSYADATKKNPDVWYAERYAEALSRGESLAGDFKRLVKLRRAA